MTSRIKVELVRQARNLPISQEIVDLIRNAEYKNVSIINTSLDAEVYVAIVSHYLPEEDTTTIVAAVHDALYERSKAATPGGKNGD